MGDTFEKHMRERRMQAYFQSLDIKVSDAWTLFKLLDKRNEHVIDLNQFVEGCLQLKGPATSIEIESLATEFHWFAEHVDRKFLQLESRQSQFESHLRPARQSEIDRKFLQKENYELHPQLAKQPAKMDATSVQVIDLEN